MLKRKSVAGLPDTFVIWDVEITAWAGSHARGWSNPDEFKEIIQIGAIVVSKLKEGGCFETYVTPVRNPILSAYIQELTEISQADIDEKGVTIKSAIAALYALWGDLPFYSWGTLDEEALRESAELSGVALPFREDAFHDMRPIFRNYGIDADAYMSSTIIQAFGKRPKRRAHTGLNDARTILDALRELAS